MVTDRITIITRADDCGCSHSMNMGIMQALEGGILKNISLLAPCDFIDEAARLFAGTKEVCFGLHAAINGEWEPVLPASLVPSLVHKDGKFPENPNLFVYKRPVLDEVMIEFQAQLNKLRDLGFQVTYVDTHWLVEYEIPGLEERLSLWAKAEGLLYHANYCSTLKKAVETNDLAEDRADRLGRTAPGQYLYVAHPALNTPEEKLFTDSRILQAISKRGIMPIRYDEAECVTEKIPPLYEWWFL